MVIDVLVESLLGRYGIVKVGSFRMKSHREVVHVHRGGHISVEDAILSIYGR